MFSRENNSRVSLRNKTLETHIDRQSVRESYNDVRSDFTETNWAVFQFEGNQICSKAVGSDFADFRTQFVDDERAFGFVRIQSGDEMSKRTKFLFVTWLGPNVSTMKRARLSSDKALVKEIIMNFAVELQIETPDELNYEFFREAVCKAGGANYGTGVREL
ncbi:coactosin-like protein isoform X1 [Daphnia pulex]|uniref:Coactosin-like protein n=1 Tax=Daphnia pulex TaxID=6669 RepID=E9G309_DAPPU|nr:coactosin-like protein isoform X1 [Daphnia pulex]XP_046642281.1 coactosin-like protein isoform X1 [Daphnia pulicaria]EFX86412.1 hypothetical protein DAPPUDRAFT_308455 [Daphnia pulex]|eukprot:EFX86412.1 hypothetical protein DAPPUDRAFT_308455 [Daphnia pulex]